MMGNYHVRFGGRERRVLIEARPSRPNADVTSGIVCDELGLPPELHDNHASYVAGWLAILKSDKSAIITAAAKAEQAYRWLRQWSVAEPVAADGARRLPAVVAA